jgi:hypothetical protein
MKIKLSILLFLTAPLFAFPDCDEKCPPFPLFERPITWRDRVRLKTLKNLNQFLNWSFGDKYKKYELDEDVEEEKIIGTIPEIKTFVQHYGYFSLHPLVGKVTTEEIDLTIICCLLKTLYEKGGPSDFMQIAIGEAMTKVLAYRDLKIGERLTIPVIIDDEVHLEKFTVDRIFNLWYGMPAFGCIPETSGVASILIFRGTDFSLDSQRGWASLMSDLDIGGPGFSAFQRSQKQISKWLKAIHSQGKAARVMGFSLGGALAAYTYIYENQWLADDGSISFCAPGVRQKVIDEWALLPEERQRGFVSYVTQGDIVSKVGRLFGTVYALLAPKNFKPLTAHTMIMSSLPDFTKAEVDVIKENESR